MLLFYKFALAAVIFASSVVAQSPVVNTRPGANCTNPGLLTEDFGDCLVEDSQGLMSTADCAMVSPDKNQTHYYCVIEGDGYCLPSSLSPERVTGGECFLTQ